MVPSTGDIWVRGDTTDDFIRIWGNDHRYFVKNSRDEIKPGHGCRRLSPHLVRCEPTISDWRVNAGGRGGDDHISLARGGLPRERGHYVFGQRGEDVLLGSDAIDLISGNTGDDHVNGGKGEDYLWGDQGSDVLLGGQGPDTIDASDSNSDRVIDCGPGHDFFLADAEDPELVSCEQLSS